MAAKNSDQTVIAQGVRVEGDFKSQGSVVIEGEVLGSVQTAEFLQVGSGAKIHADVNAQNAVVAGEIQGNIEVGDKLELTESARVKGDLNAEVLSVAAGAQLNGKVSMGAKRAHKSEPTEESKEAE